MVLFFDPYSIPSDLRPLSQNLGPKPPNRLFAYRTSVLSSDLKPILSDFGQIVGLQISVSEPFSVYRCPLNGPRIFLPYLRPLFRTPVHFVGLQSYPLVLCPPLRTPIQSSDLSLTLRTIEPSPQYPSPSSGAGYSLGLRSTPSGSEYLSRELVHLLLSHSVCIRKCQMYIE